MGDLRNKIAKQLRDARHRAYMARRYPPKPTPPPIRCECGLTIYETTTIVAYTPDSWRPTRFLCPACTPPHLLLELAPIFINSHAHRDE